MNRVGDDRGQPLRPGAPGPGHPPSCEWPVPRRRGTILIVTMWILVVLAGLVVAMAASMRVEGTCSANGAAELQAEAIEQGAVQYVLAHVDNLEGKSPSDTDMPCEAIRVGDGAFWILRPDLNDDRLYACGLVDEAAKLNLNTAGAGMMTRLLPTTSEMAVSVVDWRDADDTVTPGGGESEYYLLLSDPYRCKNSPLETVEELLLVKGFTRDILYGEDLNRNGVLDDGEDSSGDGKLDRGLAPFVTVYSAEANTDASGAQRINVNEPRNQALTDLLAQNLSEPRAAVVRARIRLGRPFRNLLDLYIRSGLTQAEFEPIADRLTTRTGRSVRGLINVTTAPREVLACLPGLDDADVSALLAKRSDAAANLDSIVWVAQALKPAKAIAIGDHITLCSYQFSADIVSIAGDGRAFRRCLIVVDTRSSPPKVIYRQNLTHLGWPLAEDIQTRLRAGVAIDVVCGQQKTVKTSDR